MKRYHLLYFFCFCFFYQCGRDITRNKKERLSWNDLEKPLQEYYRNANGGDLFINLDSNYIKASHKAEFWSSFALKNKFYIGGDKFIGASYEWRKPYVLYGKNLYFFTIDSLPKFKGKAHENNLYFRIDLNRYLEYAKKEVKN